MKPLVVVPALALFVASSLCAQRKGQTNASPTQSTRQILAAQADLIADLAQRVKDLEKRVQTVEQQREQKTTSLDSSRALRLDLRQAKLELARFDCTLDQDRAFAIALAEGKAAQTYEGAAAMNCTQRLGKIVDKVVEALENQE